MASVKCPKCGARVSIDGVGTANSALCFSCGASILIPNVESDILVPLAQRRDSLRSATRKPPKPEGKPKRSGPILNLSVLDPVIDLEATGASAPDIRVGNEASPVVDETVAEADHTEPVVERVKVGPVPPLPVTGTVPDLYALDTLPRLQEADRIAKRRAEGFTTRRPLDVPPPLPDEGWVVRGFPSEKEASNLVEPMAMLSFVLSIASFLCGLGPVLSLPALILGGIALIRINGAQGRVKGGHLARVGIALSIINLIFMGAFSALL